MTSPDENTAEEYDTGSVSRDSERTAAFADGTPAPDRLDSADADPAGDEFDDDDDEDDENEDEEEEEESK